MMISTPRTIALRVAAAAVLCLALTAGALAMNHKTGGVSVTDPWARQSFGRAVNSNAYMTITNHGTADDTLVAARVGVAKVAELHTHIMDNGIMRMRRVEGGIDAPAGKTVMLKPGGLHVMFIGLHKPLMPGERFPMTLVFKKAGEVMVDVSVKSIKEETKGHDHHNMHQPGGGEMKMKMKME